MNSIRQICTYVPRVRDKYYISDDAVIFVSLWDRDYVNEDGDRFCIRAWRRKAEKEIKASNLLFLTIPNTSGKCIFTHQGQVLKRMQTALWKPETGSVRVRVGLYGHDDKKIQFQVSRLMAACFIGPVDGFEVHHIDGDTKNNRITNLQILTSEEHKIVHGKRFND